MIPNKDCLEKLTKAAHHTLSLSFDEFQYLANNLDNRFERPFRMRMYSEGTRQSFRSIVKEATQLIYQLPCCVAALFLGFAELSGCQLRL